MPHDPVIRRRILDEAIGLLAREGPERMTMRALGERIDHSPASIYLHFRSKEALEIEIALRGFALLWETLAPALELDDPRKALAESMRRYLEFGLANRELYRHMFEAPSHLQQDPFSSDPSLERVRRTVVSLYERGVREGVFRPCDPEVESAVGWAALHGYVLFVNQGYLPDQSLRCPPQAVGEALIEQRLRALEP
jgi:AcrR family transcriptional regulator